MAIIGNQLQSTNYASDQFSGNGSTVAYTLSLAPASAASIAVYISGLYQTPGVAYTVSGTTLTFTGAPPSGTNNIYVLHHGIQNQNLVPVNGSITPAMLNNANAIFWSASNNNIGIGNTTPAHLLSIGGSAQLAGAVGDGAPSIVQTLSVGADTYNWAQSSLANNMSAGKLLVNVIGQGASSYNSAFWGYKHANTGDQLNNRAVFGMYNKNSIMEMDGYGRVTKQYQPFFYARNGDESGDGITTNPFRFSDVVHNVGGHFVTSGTGAFTRFVAPVAGTYLFSTNPGYKQTSFDFVCRMRVNGSYITDVIRLIGAPQSHSGGAYSITLRLNANDYVDLASDGTTYHRNNSSVPNFFSGCLLG